MIHLQLNRQPSGTTPKSEAKYRNERIPFRTGVPALCMLLSMSQTLLARGPTGEEMALEAYRSNRLPIVLSQDGNWVLHVDNKSVLHRTNVRDPKLHQQVVLDTFQASNTRVQEITPTANGQQVAYIGGGGCIEVVSFTENGPKTKTLRGLCTSYHSTSVALSNNGKFLALESYPRNKPHDGRDIGLFSREDGKILFKIPQPIGDYGYGETVLHMRFLDNDKKLFVVQATMGEGYEGPSYGSDIHFAIWDLQGKTLYSFYHIGTVSSLTEENFAWSFNEITGELWTIQSPSLGYDARIKRDSITFNSINLKQCGSAKKHQIKWIKGEEVVDFDIDPQGRWIAIRSGEQRGSEQPFKVSVFHLTNGNEINLGAKLASHYPVLSSHDSNLLIAFGVDAQLPRLVSIPESQSPKERIADVLWKGNHCLLEDEAPGARKIAEATAKAKRLYSVSLETSVTPENDCGYLLHPELIAYGNEAYRWGLSNDGELWVDRISGLERLDPLSGQVQQKIETPRSREVCSLPIYATKEFLNWQGDTITKRSFASHGIGKDRRVFAEKNNLTALRVQLRGKYVDVVWPRQVNSQNTNENGESNYVELITYELETGRELHKQVEHYGMGMPEKGSFTLPLSELKADKYYWELSYFGSIRARQRMSGDNIATMLWDGLKIPIRLEILSHSLSYPKVDDLGSGKAALLRSDRVVVYDAAMKRKYVDVVTKSPVHVQWLESNRLLFIETAGRYLDEYVPWSLTAYRVDD